MAKNKQTKADWCFNPDADLTISQAAELLGGVNKDSVRNWIRDGRLAARKTNHDTNGKAFSARWAITRDEAQRFLASREESKPAVDKLIDKAIEAVEAQHAKLDAEFNEPAPAAAEPALGRGVYAATDEAAAKAYGEAAACACTVCKWMRRVRTVALGILLAAAVAGGIVAGVWLSEQRSPEAAQADVAADPNYALLVPPQQTANPRAQN